MHKILCWLGIHAWGKPYTVINDWQECKCCEKLRCVYKTLSNDEKSNG